MSHIAIHPARYPMFGPADGASFYLVTHSDLVERFVIHEEGSYTSSQTVACAPDDTFEALLHRAIPEPAHILVITPRRLFESPPLEVLGQQRKLAVLACASTPTPLAAIEHFLGVIERTDLHAMVETAERFFAVGERCAYLELFDDACDTHATFYHLDATYEWFEQLGSLDWGSQQLVPSGEISVLPLFHGSYDPSKRPHIMGEITLQGYPIVHSGRPAFLLEDQARIYRKLALLEHYPVIATVEHGVIRALRATHKKAKPAVDMLQRLFDVDSRYRSIWEIGFGINGNHTMYPGNVGMNEVHGGAFGAIHWGLGLTPWTQYHIDIICPGTRVAANTGEILIGPPPRTTAGRLSGPVGHSGMRRNRVDACPCTKSLPS